MQCSLVKNVHYSIAINFILVKMDGYQTRKTYLFINLSHCFAFYPVLTTSFKSFENRNIALCVCNNEISLF
jgi:hypothetical protein